MTLARARHAAVAGIVLRGLFYWKVSSLAYPDLGMFANTIAEPLAWSLCFLRPSRATASAAVFVTLAHAALEVARRWNTLSPLSLDTIQFVLGTVLLALAWAALLLARKPSRPAMSYIFVVNGALSLLTLYQAASSWAIIKEFGAEEPWRLILTPLIWILYYATQALVARVYLGAQKA